ncbi:O-glucosyltransferase rumi homolog isoform X2 [Punica granatum]|uniref:O-glucosyltransferase rumi homolog isoform X2 n=3 Tax=Punica granatum TaxID=22663 RepID=A0A6P8DML4_PUNGR|nr:O-glucosyltransferase rumi homolog isoform X2 [Punica granatum]
MHTVTKRSPSYGSGVSRHFTDTTTWRAFIASSPARSTAVFSLFLFLLAGAFLTSRLLDATSVSNAAARPVVNSVTSHILPHRPPETLDKSRKKIEIPLNCTAYNLTRSCPANYPSTFELEKDPNRPSTPMCPDYFRWIHEDLKPWARTGITKDMVEKARRTANFRLVILNGKAYVETYEKGFQTRDVFTIWGILQLLRRYPGKVPDLELMFDCVDWPVIRSQLYRGPNVTGPPPLFRYCGNDATLDIVFPDWSFWGWPEINIKPWEALLEDLKEGNRRTKWVDREPYAYWKGNPEVAKTRQDLLKCNVSEKQDWNARVYAQNWGKESQEGYKQSNLASQCMHRYKIYIEGSAWSVSEKYILACDSVTLIVKPHYYDFFTRGLLPVHHYWPIREDSKCKSIKFAVDWGNSHKKKAQEIGKAASSFIHDDLKMDLVYDYMFHLLNGYAKLLTYKPTIPEKATELCSEAMACEAQGLVKKFMLDSLVKGPRDSDPCNLPPPFDPVSLFSLRRRKENSVKQVETWESMYYDNQHRQD